MKYKTWCYGGKVLSDSVFCVGFSKVANNLPLTKIVYLCRCVFSNEMDILS